MSTISIRIAEPRTLARRATQAVIPASLWGRIVTAFRSAWCVINGGHYKVLHTAPDRLALRCVSCGHMSPGWEIGSPRAVRRASNDHDGLRVRPQVAA